MNRRTYTLLPICYLSEPNPSILLYNSFCTAEGWYVSFVYYTVFCINFIFHLYCKLLFIYFLLRYWWELICITYKLCNLLLTFNFWPILYYFPKIIKYKNKHKINWFFFIFILRSQWELIGITYWYIMQCFVAI